MSSDEGISGGIRFQKQNDDPFTRIFYYRTLCGLSKAPV
jgi:hypothetical protein